MLLLFNRETTLLAVFFTLHSRGEVITALNKDCEKCVYEFLLVLVELSLIKNYSICVSYPRLTILLFKQVNLCCKFIS